VAGEGFVEVGVVSKDDVGEGAILAEDVFQEELGFRGEGLAELGGEFGEFLAVHLGGLGEVCEVQPLGGEAGGEGGGFGVFEHALDVLLADLRFE